jgi:hypothetical protein
VLCGAVFGAPAAGKSTLVRALAVKGGRDAAGGLLSAAGPVAVAGGGGGGGGGGGEWEGHEVKTLVLSEVAGAATPDCPLVDLSRCGGAAAALAARPGSAGRASLIALHTLPERASTPLRFHCSLSRPAPNPPPKD